MSKVLEKISSEVQDTVRINITFTEFCFERKRYMGSNVEEKCPLTMEGFINNSGHSHKISPVVNNHVINCVTGGIRNINVSYMIG